MLAMKTFVAAAALALMLAPPVAAETKHHPEGAETKTPPQTQPARPGMRRGADSMDQCEAGMGMMCMMGEHHRMGMMGEAGMQQRVDRHLAALKTQLKITDAQTKSWDAYAAAVRDAAKAMADQRKNMHDKAAGSTLPQRLDLHEAMLVSHLEHLRKSKSAAGALYAALTDDQKKIADKAMMGQMMRGRGTMRH